MGGNVSGLYYSARFILVWTQKYNYTVSSLSQNGCVFSGLEAGKEDDDGSNVIFELVRDRRGHLTYSGLWPTGWESVGKNEAVEFRPKKVKFYLLQTRSKKE